MGVSNAELIDLTRTTLKDLPKESYEVAWSQQDYEFCRIYQEDRVQVDGGTSIQRNVVLNHSGAARYRQLFDTDTPAVKNIHYQIEVPWTQIGTNYSWDVVEIRRQMNSAKGFINLLKTRRLDGMWSLADLIEQRGWLTPTSATDTTHPFGIPYFLNMCDDGVESEGDFIGKTIRYQNGSTGTICSGIDAASEDKWRNYAGTYTKVDNTLLRRLRRLFLKCRFRPPAMVDSPGKDAPGKVKIYCNDATAIELQDLSTKLDDATAPKDLAGKALVDVSGVIMFNRRPIVYIPNLDGVDYDPIYVVDWSKIQPIVQDGYWMEESEPMNDRFQHTVLTMFVDGSHQNLCLNRRTAGGVLHKKIPA